MMSEDQAPDQTAPEETRRGFGYEIAAVVLGGLVSLTPLVAGLATFFHPLRRKSPGPKKYQSTGGGGDGFIRVTSLDALSVNSAPQRFPVIANQQDAWNFEPDQPIGAVFVERTADDEVRVFNATCPHAGCSVSCNGTAFECPCHNSSFNLDGSKRISESGRENPSPRPLDKLAVDTSKLQDGEVWVEFKNFYTGKEEAIPK